jgi:rubrerythrin
LDSKNLFQQLAEKGEFSSFGAETREIWTQALKIEEKAEKMYREEAQKEPDPIRKRLLDAIADEEKTHVYLIDNILSFMIDPRGFVESSDYRNFMSWEGR